MDEQMHDTSWVKGFLHNMFSGKSADAEKYMAEKMQYINKPFYKYCYVCEDSKRTAETIDYNIQNFENNELFFQDPSQFNDPLLIILDYIVVHSQEPETQVQIRGRYRNDLDRLYLLDYNSIQVPEEYLDCELSAEQREELCQVIGLRDPKGRVYKWSTVKSRLESTGYSIVEKRRNNKRCYIITL